MRETNVGVGDVVAVLAVVVVVVVVVAVACCLNNCSWLPVNLLTSIPLPVAQRLGHTMWRPSSDVTFFSDVASMTSCKFEGNVPNISDQYLQILIILLMEEILQQLRLVVFPIIFEVLYNPGGYCSRISSIYRPGFLLRPFTTWPQRSYRILVLVCYCDS